MKRRPPKNQSGFALLVFVLAIMGAGGLLLVGFSEGMLDAAESKKFEHNKRVLKEAKQALLQFAYNYPVTNDKGPGRLPCADTDNDGIPNTCNSFGRFPWAQQNLNFYDIRDADGERLWYAVSSKFFTQATSVNSDTSGNITLRDQSGNIIYDGSNPGSLTQYGIAALIIAPGAILDRNGVSQDRSLIDDVSAFDTIADDDPGIVDADNYLDLVSGTEDNAILNLNLSGSGDGFILGPIANLTNDQFIVITAAEVIEMAEKATLQAYRTVIEDYRVKTSPSYCDAESPDGARTEAACLAAATPGTWTKGPYCVGESPDGAITEAACLAAATPGTWISTLGPYPWLHNYLVPASEAISSYFPMVSDWTINHSPGNVGRIPTIFGDYFTEASGALLTLETGLSGSIGITIPEDIPCTGCEGGKSDFTYNDDEFKFHDFATVKTPIFQENQILTDVQFVDLATAGEGQLTGNAASAVSGTLEMYFWDDDLGPHTKIFTPCGDDGDGIPEFTDCNRDISGNPKPGGTNDIKTSILYINIPIDFPYSSGVVNIDMDYIIDDPTITFEPATATSHALIKATFLDTNIINGTMPTISGGTWEISEHYHPLDTTITTSQSGTLVSPGFVVEGPLTLAISYYPELPDWVFNNNWHDSVMMAYADDYRPDVNGAAGDCITNTPCLQVNGLAGTNNDIISLLVLAGERNWVDGDLIPPVTADTFFTNDVGDVFNLENSNLDNIFDMRTVEDTGAPGDTLRDKILVIE